MKTRFILFLAVAIWTGTIPACAQSNSKFTNHDLLTGIMPFTQGGYYNYHALQYLTEPATGIQPPHPIDKEQSAHHQRYDLSGRHLGTNVPMAHHQIHLVKGKKILSR